MMSGLRKNSPEIQKPDLQVSRQALWPAEPRGQNYQLAHTEDSLLFSGGSLRPSDQILEASRSRKAATFPRKRRAEGAGKRGSVLVGAARVTARSPRVHLLPGRASWNLRSGNKFEPRAGRPD